MVYYKRIVKIREVRILISFKTMWNDVNNILNKDDVGLNIIEKFSSGFTVRDNDETIFVTRDDFVDFWCKILCGDNIEVKKLIDDDKSKEKYIYSIIKKLPYIKENLGMMSIVE